MWGRRMLFDYKNKDGVRLQGILALPDDYKPGEKRPMIVTFYEKNSQNLHRYSAPSYLTGMGSSPMQAVSQGYITMLPDIHFRTGSSHSDMLECVEAAVKKVIELGYVDPKRIGINGHSYGGEGAAFIGTRSKLFAAVGMGAGVTDLYSDFNQSWGWSYQVTGGSGANGNDYYLFGQGRWGFSPWDNPELYRFESALTHVREVDGAVPDHARHRRSDGVVQRRHELLQRAALQRQEGGAARVSGRRPRAARHGESQGSDDPLLRVLRSLPEGRAGAEVDDRRRAVPEEEVSRNSRNAARHRSSNERVDRPKSSVAFEGSGQARPLTCARESRQPPRSA